MDYSFELNNENLGRNLKIMRKVSGYSQRRAAEEIGVTRSAIGMYETGERKPSFDVIVKLSDLYGYNLNLTANPK